VAQEFSMRLPLIEGQGQFGSVDGRSTGAMRYTEVLCKKSRPRWSTISTRHVDSRRLQMAPKGSRWCSPRGSEFARQRRGRIAVGMATNIPPAQFGRTDRRADA